VKIFRPVFDNKFVVGRFKTLVWCLPMAFFRDTNTFKIFGEFDSEASSKMTGAMYDCVTKQGYKELNLNFEGCTKAFSTEMVTLCAQAQKYWQQSVDISLKLPSDAAMARLFNNANWAHLIDVHSHAESRYRGYTHARTMRFNNEVEQFEVVNRILDILLSAIRHFKRSDLSAMEWAINEIADNVINHSESSVGGFIQLTNHSQRKQIEVVVADSGIGIPTTIRSAHPEYSDSEALDSAIREGVTRDPQIGQGNGLFGTWEITKKSLGMFKLQSGWANLDSDEQVGLRISKRVTPIKGCVVSFRIGYDQAINLEEALTFSGKPHKPVDYVDVHFELDEDGRPIFNLANESSGFGSRKAGDPVRRKLRNILAMSDVQAVAVDLTEVHLVSSSYADEVFGKLFSELGPLEFSSKIALIGVDPLVKQLIDKAIVQRMQQPGST
jgi:anti-sigma regulatory factor (Ser/Thr protein kinase)